MADAQIDRLSNSLYRALRTMDAEATAKFTDKYGTSWPTGLRQYHEYYKIMGGRSARCEPSWSQRIAQILCTHGMPTNAEWRYPAYAAALQGKNRSWCDLRVSLDGGEWFWIEVKGSWPICYEVRNGKVVGYVFDRYKSYLSPDTADDFGKLATLRRPDAHWIGVLLIGFDAPGCRLDKEVEAMARINAPGWVAVQHPEWIEASYETRAQTWFWYSSVT